MSPINEIDPLLVEIASPLAREADTMLDLRAAVSDAPHPGRCVSCYFKLLAAASDEIAPRLTPLRCWLESHIEIAATSDHGDLLETLPLQLDETPDLESCCRRTINLMLEDRPYEHVAELALQFRFRPASVDRPSAPATVATAESAA